MSNYDLFISYSRRDKAFVQHLHQAIESSGRDAWVDWENIPLTAEWFEEIKRGIEASDAFVFVISPDSVDSEICAAELDYGLKNHKRLVPILRRELSPEQHRKLHEAVSSHNWLFFREEDTFERAFEGLVHALDTDLDYVRAHTRLQTRALEWQAKGRDPSFVLRGQDLADAERWQQEAIYSSKKEPQITDLQREYIRASQAAEKARRRERILTLAISAALAVAIVALGVAVYQSLRAQQEADRALRLSLAANSRIALDNANRDLAIALALSANRGVRASSEADRALSDAAYSPGTRLVYRGHTGAVNAVAFSPLDGRYALSGGADGVLRLWEVITGQDVRAFEGHAAAVRDLTFSADGARIASVDDAGELRVWDVETGESLLAVQAHEGVARTVRFSPDGALLATGGEDGALRWWDAATGEMRGEYTDFLGLVDRALFIPSTGYILAIAIDSPPVLINPASGDVVLQFSNQIATYESLAEVGLTLAADGETVLYAAGITPRAWNVYVGETIRQFPGHGSNVNSLAISRDGRYAISSAWRENSMRLWDFNTGAEITRFDGHQDVITNVAISPSGRYALSSSEDATVRVWDLDNGALIQTYSTDDMADVYGVDFSPGGRYVVSGEASGVIRLWDRETGEVVRTFEGHIGRVWAVRFSPDGRRLLSGGDDRTLQLWDVERGENLATYFYHGSTVTSLAFNADGSRALSGSNDRKIRLWDLSDLSLQDPLMTYEEDDGPLRALAFSPDGRHFAAGANDARLVDLETGETVMRFAEHGDRVNALDFSTDGTRLVTGSADATIMLWDVEGGEVLRVFQGHTSQVRSVMFNGGESHILSSSADATLRLWNIETGLEERQFKGHSEWINQAVFSPDFAFAVSGSWDNTLKVWHIHSSGDLIAWVESNRFVRDLTCNERRIYLVESATEAACVVVVAQ